MSKAVVFGAGNIGRGFLGILLHQSGYRVTFVDVDARRVEEINKYREYPVFSCSEAGTKEQVVSRVRAIRFDDTNAVAMAVRDADLVLTAVGKRALELAAQPIAEGLTARIKYNPDSVTHIAVIACENVRDNTEYLAKFILDSVPDDMKSKVRSAVSFPNCLVDRIVPNVAADLGHPLAVMVEEYYQIAIDGGQLVGHFPEVKGLEIVPSVSAKLDQKLFTLNMAHGVVGYWGSVRGHQYVHEAVADATVLALVEGSFAEVEEVLVQLHPTITHEAQQKFASDVLKRFRNHYLKDELRRVASAPKRKLAGNERLVKPASLLWEQGKIPAFLSSGIASGLIYRNKNDLQALEIENEIAERGIDVVITEVAGLPRSHPVAHIIRADYLLRSL